MKCVMISAVNMVVNPVQQVGIICFSKNVSAVTSWMSATWKAEKGDRIIK
jgi:hypothetical protein